MQRTINRLKNYKTVNIEIKKRQNVQDKNCMRKKKMKYIIKHTTKTYKTQQFMGGIEI